MSDVDGFYTAPPGSRSDAKKLDEISDVTPEIEAMAGDVGSELSKGGMVTKIEAAKIALSGGTHMVIASGKVMHPLEALASPGIGSWFIARSDPMTARKKWIAGTLVPKGALFVDKGAADALGSGKSLLPAGVTRLEGSFERGDAVVIKSGEGAELGRGLVAYDDGEARRLLGRKSSEIEAILGYGGDPELIHRDDMVLNRKELAVMSVMAERPEATIEPMMLYMGRLAREAAGELATRLDGGEECRASRHGGSARGQEQRHSRCQSAGCRGSAQEWAQRRLRRSADT